MQLLHSRYTRRWFNLCFPSCVFRDTDDLVSISATQKQLEIIDVSLGQEFILAFLGNLGRRDTLFVNLLERLGCWNVNCQLLRKPGGPDMLFKFYGLMILYTTLTASRRKTFFSLMMVKSRWIRPVFQRQQQQLQQDKWGLDVRVQCAWWQTTHAFCAPPPQERGPSHLLFWDGKKKKNRYLLSGSGERGQIHQQGREEWWQLVYCVRVTKDTSETPRRQLEGWAWIQNKVAARSCNHFFAFAAVQEANKWVTR